MRKFLFAALLTLSSGASAQTLTGGSTAASGTAGGALSGTYPNPSIAAGVALTTPDIGAATGTSLVTTGVLTAGAGSTVGFTGRSITTSPSDGILLLQNNAASSFSRLQFGGTTSSFPSWQRSSTSLIARLADDSADAPIKASQVTISGVGLGSPSGFACISAGNLILYQVQPCNNANPLTVPGNVVTTGSVPSVTGTGTPTIASGSSDLAGEVTGGTLATSIVITFAAAKTNAPWCVVTSQSALASFSYTISTTAITVTLTATTGEKVNYICIQH